MEDEKKQHLDFIQSIITRMNANSFQIKIINITIVSALLAVYATNGHVVFVFIGIFPTTIFWFLDAYYLQQERRFRGVYDDVAGVTSSISVKNYEMPIHKYTNGKYTFFNCFKSKTIIWVYLPIIIILLTIGIILLKKNVC